MGVSAESESVTCLYADRPLPKVFFRGKGMKKRKKGMQERTLRPECVRLGDCASGAEVRYRALKVGGGYARPITGRIIWFTEGAIRVLSKKGKVYEWSPEMDVELLGCARTER